MNRFILTIEASVGAAGGSAPVLDILIDGVPVTSSSGITAITGVGSDLLAFTLDYNGTYPASLAFRFNSGSGDPGDFVTLHSVRINGQALSGGNLTATLLAQGATASVSSTAAHDHLFGRVEPAPADLGTTTHNGTGGDDGDLRGSGGNDVIDGGNGDDRIRGLDDDDAINGGAGADTIFGENGNDIIIGGTGNDRLSGNAGDDLLYGQDDNDTLMGDAGDDVLNGGAGNDVLTGHAGNDILFGEAGDDRLIGVTGNNTMYGDAGNDVLIGGNQNDLMYGGTENDQMHGGVGDDTMYGEAGDDYMTGGNGADTADGGSGSDTMFGGAGNDTFSGGTNNDYVFGETGNDTLNGDSGDDNLVGGSGADTLNGGTGNDMLHGGGLTATQVSAILSANPGVLFSEETNSFYQLVSAAVTFAGAQGVAGTATLNGVSGHLVTVSSQTENDFVDTLAAGNQIWINAADSGVEGEWRWAGGEDDGLLLWSGDASGSAMNGFFENWAGGQPGGGATQDAAVMQADGTWNDVSATGTNYYVIEWDGADFFEDNAADTLNGGDNDDLMFGHGGNDTLNGDNGIDHLFGGSGSDIMNGGNNNDFLYDDTGANEFYGNAGNDVLDARFQTAIPSIADQITTILLENPGVNYSADTGNFYALVTGNYTFAEAITGSENNLLNGVGGHLVTITSAEENTLIGTLRLANTIWLAASDAAVEGEWRWVAGPEAGTQFWQGAAGGSVVGGMYNAWDAGEPNDYVGGEDYATMWGGGSAWNDDGPPNNNAFRADYMVEWEGTDLLVTPPAEAAQASQIMYGGAGDDSIYGGNGGDQIYGEDDNDYVEAGYGDDTVDGGNGNDTIHGNVGSDNISGGAGADILFANTDPALTAIPLNATFDTDEDGLTYADGFPVVGGTDPANVDVTSGWVAGDGYAGGSGDGAIEVNINSTGNPTGPISGHYSITVNLATAMGSAQLSFAYRMNLLNTADNGENLYLYADIDGTQYGTGGNSYVDSRIGNTSEGDSGWLTVTLDIGALAAGNHTIRLGAYVNDFSANDEEGWIRLDDIVLANGGIPSEDPAALNTLDGGSGTDTLYGSTGTDTLLGGADNDTLRSGSEQVLVSTTVLSATFAANENGFTYADGSDPANVVIGGSWVGGDGYASGSGNGSIEIDIDSTGNPAGPLWGYYSITVNVTEALINTQLSFAYRMNLLTAADNGENLYLYADIDGTQYGTGGNAWADSRLGNNTEGDSGWRTVTLDVGSLAAGSHTVSLAAYVNDVSDSGEDSWIRFDDITLVGDTVDDTIFNTLNGGTGVDDLYAGDGTDVFVFDDNADAFANPDIIHDFDQTTGDKIDVSDILDGLGVNAGNLTQYVDITSGSGVRIDVTGSGSFGAGSTVATFTGTTSVSDEATLLAGGQLII